MISSPIPVTETAPRGPAYNPAPTIGESPTRPGSMNATPPVDEPVAKRPRRSRATAPTVSWISTPFHFRAYRGSRPFRIFSRLSSRCRRDSGVDGSYRGWPFDRANSTASAPARRMCGVFRTSYAIRIGFFTSSMAATAPASRSQFIRAASIWIRPSMRIRDPVPAFKRGSSSRITIDSTTASNARPPRAKTSMPRAPATSAASWTEGSEPAPQCVIKRGRTRPAPMQEVSIFCPRPRRSDDGRWQTHRKFGDASAEFVADRAKLLHRLARGTRKRPIFRFLAGAERAPIKTPERHDSGCACDHLRRDGPRFLRTKLNPNFSEQRRHHGIDLGRCLNARALRAPPRGRDRIEERLREHTPERVLDADEEDSAHGTGQTSAWQIDSRGRLDNHAPRPI